jgi:hypothetical protein
MLIISLVLSLALLVIAARVSKAPLSWVCLWGLVFAIGPIFLGMFFPALALQAVLLAVAAVASKTVGWRARTFVVLSCLATMTAYVIIGGSALHGVMRLQDKFPYESLDARLPPSRVVSERPLSEPALERLDRLEELLAGQEPNSWDRTRIYHLEDLHERTLKVFAQSPGFGVARIIRPSEYTLRRGLRAEESISQPGTRVTFTWSTGDLEEPGQLHPGDDFTQNWQLHSTSIVDFVNVKGFGYVKDRQHVAGFQGHQFSQVPEPDRGWVLRTVDLMGVVVHDRPVVYVTANLPRMEELRDTPMRPPDDFEALGLAALRRGDDFFVRDATEGRRMLGAIRSARKCVACHEGERGNLLGAFSYTLTREK